LTVMQLFDQRCLATPALPAIEYRGQILTYAELEHRADSLARLLAERDVAGRIVGIAAERSFSLPVAILAVMRAGAAYLPLDMSYPSARLAFMMDDSNPRVLLTQRSVADNLPVPPATRTIYLDEQGALTGEEAPSGRSCSWQTPDPDDLAYVIYTSGSTGTPKAVEMPHGPMANLIAWQCASSSCGEQSRTLQYSAASFDASFQEIFSTFASGGCLVLVGEGVRRDPYRLLRFIAEKQVNRIFMPFVALQALAHAGNDRQLYPGSLREVITAGEQLHVTPVLREFFTMLPRARLENQYGPSETHIVTALRLGPRPSSWPERPSVGWPIANARIHILDNEGHLAGPDAVGEIAIAGDVLARGYLRRPSLSAARFVPEPSGAAPPGSRMYRTGDVGRMEPDGRVHVLGRSDTQVKIRGYRVELGEVESAVKALPGLADAVVVAHGDTAESRRLIAYVLGENVVPADVRARLARTLPEYAVPSVVIALDRFPVTPSGKVDRRALARREVAFSGSGDVITDSAVYRTLKRLWEETLNAVAVGPHDNFLQLGGTSLLAAVLLTRVNAELGVQADLETFLNQPTVAALGRWIEEQRTGHAEPAARSTANEITPAAAFQEAKALMLLGRHRAAVPAFQAAAADPLLAPRALHAAADCLHQFGAEVAADLLYQRAALAGPGPAEKRELYLSACALQDTGQPAEAAGRFETLLAYDAAYADAWERLQTCRDRGAESAERRLPPPSALRRLIGELDRLDLLAVGGHGTDAFDEDFYQQFENSTILDAIKKRLEMVQLLAACDPHAVTSSLDVGSGTLRYPQILDRYGVRSFGIDVNDSGVRSCVDARWLSRFAVADGSVLPFRDSAFDLVTAAMGTVNHFSSQQRTRFFAEAHRVLRPGGRLIVSAWDPACTFQGFLSFYSSTRRAELRSRLLPRRTLALEAEAAGYGKVSVTPFCISPDWLLTSHSIAGGGASTLTALAEWDQRQITRDPNCAGQMFLLIARRLSAEKIGGGPCPTASRKTSRSTTWS
jgi:amino acid adenylation domain-containing protein